MDGVNYQSNRTPPEYRCAHCGATGCKLWRQYQTFADQMELLCAIHAAEDQSKDVSSLDDNGTIISDLTGTRHDSIGWLVPAVPTEDGGHLLGVHVRAPWPGARGGTGCHRGPL
jgi:hypothetical protein